MSQPQPIGWLLPQTPIPVATRYVSIAPIIARMPPVMLMAIHQFRWYGASTIRLMVSVTSASDGLPSTSRALTCGSWRTVRSAMLLLQFRIRVPELGQVSGARARIQFFEQRVIAILRLGLCDARGRIINVAEDDSIGRARLRARRNDL